jgi:YbgC/YbaW family acyl-CoA thioester hydrolase
MFIYHFSARGYELDSYGHVNHAVYFNYLEQARWELFLQAGLISTLQELDILVVVIEAQARYHREINQFDEMEVRTEVTYESPYLVFRHRIYFSGTSLKACTATVKTLCTDKGRMVRDIPEAILSKLI